VAALRLAAFQTAGGRATARNSRPFCPLEVPAARGRGRRCRYSTCADYDAATAGLNAGATRAAASSTGRCRSLSAINDYRPVQSRIRSVRCRPLA